MSFNPHNNAPMIILVKARKEGQEQAWVPEQVEAVPGCDLGLSESEGHTLQHQPILHSVFLHPLCKGHIGIIE